MGSWIIVGIQLSLSIITFLGAVLAVLWARSASREGREEHRMLDELRAEVRSFHGRGCSGPSVEGSEAEDPRRR